MLTENCVTCKVLTFLCYSLCTTLSLQWEPEVIAVALMYLAGKLSKFEVVDWSGRTAKHLRWWDMFVEDVTMDLLEGKQFYKDNSLLGCDTR